MIGRILAAAVATAFLTLATAPMAGAQDKPPSPQQAEDEGLCRQVEG
jgi:hypothetical protein